MRLIDADVLKEMVPTTSVDFFENCRNCSLLSEEQVMELVDMTPTVDMWIPCSERLPNESDYYLVTIINPFGEKEVCVIWFAYKADYYGVSEWRELTDDDTVLAWMPLPEPWKGE